jgi:hypothetical protein
VSNKNIKEVLKTLASSLKEYVDNQLSNYAKSSDIPTKVSQLINDSAYLKSVPLEYITEDELNEKGYANKSDIPTAEEIAQQVIDILGDGNEVGY